MWERTRKRRRTLLSNLCGSAGASAVFTYLPVICGSNHLKNVPPFALRTPSPSWSRAMTHLKEILKCLIGGIRGYCDVEVDGKGGK